MVKSLLLSLALSIPCLAASGNIVVNQFSGLDTQDNPSALQPSQSQDLLNVRLQPGGKSVYKRDGYALFQTLSSTSPIHGGYHFQQTSGSDVQLWGSDIGLYGIVNDAAAVRIASGTVNSTWQCTDNLGFAYCLNNSGTDLPVKTDGSLANTTYQVAIPSGTVITSTPLQLVVSGVTGNLSTIYVSANNNFLNFVAGPLPTDPYTEIINAPGSRITHMAYYFGKLFWWKDQSFGYISGSASQGTVSITIVSNQIGTLDNSSAFWNPTTYATANAFSTSAGPTSNGNPYFNEMSSLGGIFFRGQDNHIYQYDGYTLTRLSRIITPNITASSKKKANLWTQTLQSDFQAGASSPTYALSFTAVPNSVVLNTGTNTFTTSGDFSSGVTSNTEVVSGSVRITTDNVNVNNYSFESAINNATDWSLVSGARVGTTVQDACTQTPHSGSFMYSSGFNTLSSSVLVEIVSLDGDVLGSTTFTTGNNGCGWVQRTISLSGQGRKAAQIVVQNAAGSFNSTIFLLSGSDITFYSASSFGGGGLYYFFLDDFTNGRSDINLGWYRTPSYDTGFTKSIMTITPSITSINPSTDYQIQSYQSSSDNVTWSPLTFFTSPPTIPNATVNRYVRFVSTWTRVDPGGPHLASTLDSVNYVYTVSTGTFLSAVNNAPSLTSWGNFTSNDAYVGISSISYSIRSSTNSFTVLSATPTWVSQSKNSTITASTGTYFQLKANFYVSATTETATLSDFTFNWFEGNASDKAYITYFQDAIWFSVSSGSTTSTNNTIFYLDLLNSTWLKDNITANGFAVENNSLYFGDPSNSNIYKFGSVTTDYSASILSYWKSMDFTGADPTVQNEFQQADFSFAASSNTITYTYDIDQSTTTLTPINLNLYSSKSSIIKRGLLLAVGKIGTYYNFMIGDNSSLQKWTLMGHRVRYNPLNWIPQLSQ